MLAAVQTANKKWYPKPLEIAGLAELADAPDSKSGGRKAV